MSYSIQVCDSVDQIDVAAWESLQDADDLFMDLRLLRATADSMADTDSFRFLLVRDIAGTAVAATCLWSFKATGTLLAVDNWIIRTIKRVSSVVSTLNNHRVLVCGMPVSAGQNNLRFAAGANRTEILDALHTKLMSIAKSEGLRYVIFKEFEQVDPEFTAKMMELGYYCADSLPMNQVDARWPSFEAYLATLTSKKRSQIKNTNKKCRQGEVQLIVTSDPDEVDRVYTDSVHQLYRAVLGNAEAQLETLPPTFFRNLARQFPDQTTFSYVLENDTVLAFGVVLYSDQVAYPLYVGVNYDRNNEYDLYFNVMFSMFEESLRRGVQLVSWGQTADQFKQMKLNCYQTPRHFFVTPTNLFSKTLLAAFFPYLFPKRTVAEREVVEVAHRRAA